MDVLLERYFINNFIIKNKQERLIYELSNKKKRQFAISRFSHNAQEYIKSDTILSVGTDIEIEMILKFFNSEKSLSEGYLIGTSHDGEHVELLKGINLCLQEFGASIFITKIYVLLKEETEVGSPNKYLLKA